MPNALAHSAAGALAGIAIASLVSGPLEVKAGAGIIAFIFSFLPDLDHERATARKYYRRIMPLALAILLFVVSAQVLGVGLLYSLAIAAAFAIPLAAISELAIPRHRGIMHTYLFGAGAALALFVALAILGIAHAPVLAVAAFLGYASHLVLDRLA
ncbi:MAG: metal-dependent hydrolase [Candidatus Micrarchaeia archaeon]